MEWNEVKVGVKVICIEKILVLCVKIELGYTERAKHLDKMLDQKLLFLLVLWLILVFYLRLEILSVCAWALAVVDYYVV